MSTDHYLLLFDLALFALAVVFLGRLMTQWIGYVTTQKDSRGNTLDALKMAFGHVQLRSRVTLMTLTSCSTALCWMALSQ